MKGIWCGKSLCYWHVLTTWPNHYYIILIIPPSLSSFMLHTCHIWVPCFNHYGFCHLMVCSSCRSRQMESSSFHWSWSKEEISCSGESHLRYMTCVIACGTVLHYALSLDVAGCLSEAKWILTRISFIFTLTCMSVACGRHTRELHYILSGPILKYEKKYKNRLLNSLFLNSNPSLTVDHFPTTPIP